MSAAQEVQLAGAAAPYQGLFAEPWARWLALADVCARLPQGMVGITLLLVTARHASMTVAGLVVAGYTLAQAATGPLRGRLADRRGLVPAAALCTLGYALTLLALLAAASAGLLIATAVAAGLLNPPLSPGMRNLWSQNAGDLLKQTAFALDAAVFDLAYITGPVLASGLATGLSPAVALFVMLVLTGTAVITIAAAAPGSARSRHADLPVRPAAPRRMPAPLRSRVFRKLLVTAALTNAALSATEVALTAYARHHHALWASGPLLAGVSVGSILGSLLLGARAPKSSQGHDRRLVRLLTGYACGLAILTAAGLFGPLLAVAAPLAGLCLGPTLATLFGAAAATAPRGSGTETQAWVNSIMNGGAAAGAVIAAFAAARPVLALGLASAMAALATLSAAHGRPRRGWSARTAARSGKRETGPGEADPRPGTAARAGRR
ncbi:MAG TPA: MFS transporter [Streptosporangiaceae bacterium]|nr:MFS transporter [Streptosporangiaceae bacterium]